MKILILLNLQFSEFSESALSLTNWNIRINFWQSENIDTKNSKIVQPNHFIGQKWQEDGEWVRGPDYHFIGKKWQEDVPRLKKNIFIFSSGNGQWPR